MSPTTRDGAMPAASFPYTLKRDRFSSHTLMAQLILKRAQGAAGDAAYSVLDVGCAYGFLRPYLPRPRFYLMGVDVNEKAVAQAQAFYDEVHQADVAARPDLAVGRRPDTIVFGDILEHLPDPAAVLRAVLARHAAPGTQVIVSLPNVAHLYVRLKLLAGQFEYTERGILDRTHLRFFTLQTARALVEAVGLRLASIGATPVPLPLLHRVFGEGGALFPVHAASHWAANLLKPLLAYQFVLEAYDAAR